MTGEIQAKREARERLEERREHNRETVDRCLADVIRPGLQAAAETLDWSYDEQAAGPSGGAIRCRIVGAGTKPAYAEASIDAFNPVAVLRRHPGGADSAAVTTPLRCEALDREHLDAWLEPLTG